MILLLLLLLLHLLLYSIQKRILCCPGPNIDEKPKENGTTESTNRRYKVNAQTLAMIFLWQDGR